MLLFSMDLFCRAVGCYMWTEYINELMKWLIQKLLTWFERSDFHGLSLMNCDLTGFLKKALNKDEEDRYV